MSPIFVCDYGIGNLQSVMNSLDRWSLPAKLVRDPRNLRAAEKVLLPGVGAFTAGMGAIRERGFEQEIVDHVRLRNGYLLGICLGMQMLAEEGTEFGITKGLGLIPGRVDAIDLSEHPGLRLPHMGWNDVVPLSNSSLFAGLDGDRCCYFAHSYGFKTTDSSHVLAYADYGIKVPAVVQNGRVFGAQFHPEKSQNAGRQFMKNFAALSC